MAKEACSGREAVRTEAARWVVRLSDGPFSDAEREAFAAWRDVDPYHEAAFEREAVAWEALDQLRTLRPTSSRPDPDLLADQRHVQPRQAWSRPQRWGAAVSLVAGIAGIGAMTIGLTSAAAYSTGIGEHRTVVLKDGSRLELNTDTKVLVRYRKDLREVQLIRGEALFNVVKSDRPFVVLASGARFRAASSQLAVRLQNDGAEVTVASGSVRVEAQRAAPVAPSRTLTAGVEGFYGPAGVTAHQVSQTEIDRSLAWRQGAVAFNGQTLTQAVAEFNRYNTEQLLITDDSIAPIRVAGYFQSSDLSGFVQAVTSAFPVKAEKAANGFVYLSSAG